MTVPATVQKFLDDTAAEITNAQRKFPSSDACLAALTEEVGELAKAMLSEPRANIRKEALQVAAMAFRCAEEGDPSLLPYRAKVGADNLPGTVDDDIPY